MLSPRIQSPICRFSAFLKRELKLWPVLLSLLGSAILAFGLCHIHSHSDVTEGGVLGLTLLLDYHFHISPAISGFILNLLCYVLGWKYLGKPFLLYSFISSVNFSVTYGIFEQMDPVFPNLVQNPLLAALIGAVFVGVGAGLCVLVGGAPGGDDAFAMAMAKITGKNIQSMYLLSDLVVLALALTYIPVQQILYSLLTVILSGQIIGWVQKIPVPVTGSTAEAQPAQ